MECNSVTSTSLPVHERISSLCSRITNAALSCHTLQSMKAGNGKTSIIRRLDELEVKDWLDGQLTEYQLMLMRRKKSKRKYMFKDDSKEGKMRIRMLKFELFQGTVSNQQMRRLADRMKMSAAMMFTSYPEATLQKPTVKALMEQMRKDGLDVGDLVGEDVEELFLQREALIYKQELSSRVLKKSIELEQLKKKSLQLNNESETNKQLYNSIIDHTTERDVIKDLDEKSRQELKDVEMKNACMRQILLNALLAENNVQWFNTKQMRDTVHKLGEYERASSHASRV